MNLADRLHCPHCQGRLTSAAVVVASGFPNGSLRCTRCEWAGAVTAGIADLIGEKSLADTHPDRLSGLPPQDNTAPDDLLRQIRDAVGDLWPEHLGEVLELGCGNGQLTAALIPRLNAAVRGLIVTDTDMTMLRACRERLGLIGPTVDVPVMFARISVQEDPLRDAVADTAAGVACLASVGDVRSFLAMVHRILRPGGQAFFVVPNRRYHLALCHAIADALVHESARDGAWPSCGPDVLSWVAALRRQLVHQGDPASLPGLQGKHLFDNDTLCEIARGAGFATVDIMPLDLDPHGGATVRRLWQKAAIPDDGAAELAALVVSTGARFFGLLSPHDASASMVLWLTKGIGPRPRTFRAMPSTPPVAHADLESATGGTPPRWSLEVNAHDSADGLVVSLSGWCVVNTDVVWIRLTLDGVVRDAPVWRPRPDVHEVLNVRGLYHALNALCSGVEETLVFDGLHPRDSQCRLDLAVVLANGVVARGPEPYTLVMDQPLIALQ